MAGAGKGAVFQAIIGNGILTVCKFAAFVMSGSGAMMSEAIHSFADTANQTLLYVGVRRSLRPADNAFHYGYGADRYVFALMSAMGIFVLGCGVTVYHGIHSLIHPPELNLSWIVFAVLGLSLFVDGYVLVTALREVNRQRGKKSFLQFVRSSTDPTLLAVVFEDGVACIGVVVAAAGIGLSHITGNARWDAVSSIVIGAMLGVLALWLGWRNRQLILGPAIPAELQAELVAFLEDQPSVISVRAVRTRIVAADRFRIAAEIDYNGRHLAKNHIAWIRERAEAARTDEEWNALGEEIGERIMETLGDEIDRIEAVIYHRFPRVRHVDLEAD